MESLAVNVIKIFVFKCWNALENMKEIAGFVQLMKINARVC